MNIFDGWEKHKEALINTDVSAPIANYYGTPMVWTLDGLYYFSVEDYPGGLPTAEVSKEFYDAFVKEFKGGE